MRRSTAIILVAVLALAPSALSSAPESNPPRYADERMGELKDVSDKFKFVRVKISPIYGGEWLGDEEPWDHRCALHGTPARSVALHHSPSARSLTIPHRSAAAAEANASRSLTRMPATITTPSGARARRNTGNSS